MVICRWCKKTIINAGNPQIIYSNCSDCNESHNKYREFKINRRSSLDKN